MSNVCTFYSVSQEQYDALKKGLEPVADTDDTFTGDTPLGKITAQVNFAPGSGQLQVVIIDKPMLVHMETIKSHIRNAIDTVLIPMVPPHDGPVDRPASEPTNPPRVRLKPPVEPPAITPPATPAPPAPPAEKPAV